MSAIRDLKIEVSEQFPQAGNDKKPREKSVFAVGLAVYIIFTARQTL